MARETAALHRFLVILILLLLISGCAETGPQRRYFWPPPPGEPRIEWLGSYESQLDFPRSEFRKIREFIVGTDTPTLFIKPIDIRSNGKGKVYVLDQAIHGVYIYDFNNREVELLDIPGTASSLMRFTGLAVASDGTFFLLDSTRKKILVFDKDERFKGDMNLQAMLKRPVSLAYDRINDRILVCDIGKSQIVVIDREGKLLLTIGKPGSGDGEFSYPVAASVAKNGDIVVADVMNARIQILDSKGNFIRKFGRRGDGISDFEIIKGVAVDSDFNIYVTEGRSSRILIFSQRGEFLLPLGGPYFTARTGKVAPGGFMLPQGIDIDEHDTIYVVDQLNQRFQTFQYLKPSK